MTRLRTFILTGVILLLLGALLGLSGTRTGGTASPVTASGQVELDGWKLTTPAEGKGGRAAMLDPAASTEPWLIRNGDGSLTFWAPVTGATTENSEHARTELISLNEFEAGDGQHTLRASVAVTQAPAGREDIILGQLHGAGSLKSVPFVMLHYKAGVIEAVVKKKRTGSAATRHQLLSDVGLASRFDFTISDAGNGELVFTAIAGSDSRRVTAPIPDAFRDEPVRFQAGAYQLGTPSDNAVDGGRVTFYQLSEDSGAP